MATATRARLFRSKAEILSSLSSHEELFILPLCSFTIGEWRAHPEAVRDRLLHFAVRSSCLREDEGEGSGAGAFTSVLDVPCADCAAAIERVIASYGKSGDDEQVFVQPMLTDIVLSGVAMTRVLVDGAPYFVVNYDDSGKADTVTGLGGKQHGANLALCLPAVAAGRGCYRVLCGHCLSRCLRALLAQGEDIRVCPVAGDWCECDTPDDIQHYEQRLREGAWPHDWRTEKNRI